MKNPALERFHQVQALKRVRAEKSKEEKEKEEKDREVKEKKGEQYIPPVEEVVPCIECGLTDNIRKDAMLCEACKAKRVFTRFHKNK